MGRACVVLLVLALTGCGIAARREAEEHAKELRAQTAAAEATCNSTIPANNPKTFLAKQKCLNDAEAIELPIQPDQDLVQAFMAERVAIGERVQTGKMTVAEGDAAIAEKRSQVISESQNRRNARLGVAAQVLGATAAQQSAAAQQQAASAATMRALNPPTTTCMTTGNMTTCH